ncbi:HAMP domain-containing sensor histidine kinase [Clostridium sp. JN-1]|uniref:sensor histidine kinase n=1 Tax=Clostridium sp. JN-1 TaxID=2483110 RepID=UPI000F0BA0A1|nr:HAMP domain-containing sensor histidine kinase [Clostridium sp. JN-1]
MRLLKKLSTNLSLTRKFLITLIIIVIVEFVLNLFVYFQLVVYTQNSSYFSPERFTLNFSDYIYINDNTPYLKDDGKKALEKESAWIQIIDNSFKEVYSCNKPKEVPAQYTPIKFAHIYKYDIANSSVFVSAKELNNKNFTYIIGFPMNTVGKYTLIFNPSSTKQFIWNGFLILVLINIVTAIILSYFLFGKKLGKPLENIIEGINELSCGNYEIKFEEKGIYKNVFKNLNNLGITLRDNKNKRDELDKMRDTWISSISHDVKTPLSSVKGYSELMKDTEYTFSREEILDYSAIIYDKASYIEGLIGDLNLTYKIKNKAFTLDKKEVNLVHLLQNIIIEILNHPLYSNRNITFEPSEEIICAYVDEALFKRCLVNLIFNSIIHNDEDVKINVSIYKMDNIYIEIKDNGNGISPEDLKHIFERYYRGTNTSSSKEGSGLGMAIAKQVLDIHEASISIESSLGVGTTLTLVL